MADKITIFDSTLRDGAQAEGISFSVEDKLRIVLTLDKLGVDIIEAGNPGSNPKDIAFFEALSNLTLEHARVCAFGSTRRSGIPVDEDANLKALVDAGTPVVAVFGKSSTFHITEI
ncbi:MAG: citramalate synthase, partial [Eubacterium sp.]